MQIKRRLIYLIYLGEIVAIILYQKIWLVKDDMVAVAENIGVNRHSIGDRNIGCYRQNW
jgi:hypothetical protein